MLEFDDTDALAQALLPYGSAVLVTEPPDLRDAVIRHLRAVLASTPSTEGGAA